MAGDVEADEVAEEDVVVTVEDVDEVDIIAMDMVVAVVVVSDVRADIPATTTEVQIALIRVVEEAMVVTEEAKVEVVTVEAEGEAAMVTIVVQAGETMDGKSLLVVACCIFLSADIMLSIF
mmetsp:Transcript_9644/g.11181  ORF Transcript_9644/g.11181 Transcript_9644/m.11181 type:complete len:121 (-) Transcript_9644:124-486(-)